MGVQDPWWSGWWSGSCPTSGRGSGLQRRWPSWAERTEPLAELLGHSSPPFSLCLRPGGWDNPSGPRSLHHIQRPHQWPPACLPPVSAKPSHTELDRTPGSSGPWPRAEAGRQAGSGAAGLDTFCLALFPPGCRGTRGHSPGAHGPPGTAWPAAAQKSPGGQGRHQLTSGAPFSAFQVPAGQGHRLGSSVPAGQKWPGGQRSPKGSPS